MSSSVFHEQKKIAISQLKTDVHFIGLLRAVLHIHTHKHLQSNSGFSKALSKTILGEIQKSEKVRTIA